MILCNVLWLALISLMCALADKNKNQFVHGGILYEYPKTVLNQRYSVPQITVCLSSETCFAGPLFNF
jgi:hypothetical protein